MTHFEFGKARLDIALFSNYLLGEAVEERSERLQSSVRKGMKRPYNFEGCKDMPERVRPKLRLSGINLVPNLFQTIKYPNL